MRDTTLALAALAWPLGILDDRWNFHLNVRRFSGAPYLLHYHLPELLANDRAPARLVRRLLRPRALASVVQSDARWDDLWRIPRRRREAEDLILTEIPGSGINGLSAGVEALGVASVIREPPEVMEALGWGPEPWGVPMVHRNLDRALLRSSRSRRFLATAHGLPYLARLGPLSRVFPRAVILALVRHPFATLASWKSQEGPLARGEPPTDRIGGTEDPLSPSPLREGYSAIRDLPSAALRRAFLWGLFARELLRHRRSLRIVRREELEGERSRTLRETLRREVTLRSLPLLPSPTDAPPLPPEEVEAVRLLAGLEASALGYRL